MDLGNNAYHSCILGDILNCFNSNNYMLVLHIDLKKAFDSVSHKIILEKLENCRMKEMH